MYYDPEKKILVCPEHASRLYYITLPASSFQHLEEPKLIKLAAQKNSTCFYCYKEKKNEAVEAE
jgi:hypothetical protein